MQMNTNRSERAMTVPGPGVVKAASPLQREINELKGSLEGHFKTLEELRNRLRPVFQDVIAPGKSEPLPPEQVLSEMPTQVRDCRSISESNTSLVNWLIERLEV